MVRLLPLPGVFQPHSDSRMLGDYLGREPIEPETSVLDLCTGSGLLALLAASHGARDVVAVDVSRRALASVRLNAWISRLRVEVARGDLFAAVPGRRFDLIVSNPPYLPGPEFPVRGPARAWEAGPRGRVFLDRICAQARQHLHPGGVLLLVHSSLCDEDQTVRTLSRSGLETSIVQRHRGPLGQRLSARAPCLREAGLLADGEDEEDVVIVRAARPGRAHVLSARALARSASPQVQAAGRPRRRTRATQGRAHW